MKAAGAIEIALEVVENEGYELEMLIQKTDDRAKGSQKRVLKYVKLEKMLKAAHKFAEDNSL